MHVGISTSALVPVMQANKKYYSNDTSTLLKLMYFTIFSSTNMKIIARVIAICFTVNLWNMNSSLQIKNQIHRLSLSQCTTGQC